MWFGDSNLTVIEEKVVCILKTIRLVVFQNVIKLTGTVNILLMNVLINKTE